jgi:solute:Na+ symporter, SSS family
LGTSLINNAILLAAKINQEKNVLTLPDVLAKRYGKVVEVMVSCVSLASFMFLLAGNLVGQGFISAYCWGVSPTVGIWVAAAIVWGYTVTGGLFSVAYTDVVQGLVGWYVCVFFWWIRLICM